MDKYICPTCGKEFVKKVNKVSQAIYCSQTCAYKGRSLGFTKRHVVRPYNCYRKPPSRCLICQTEFISRKPTHKYCSRRCFEVAHREVMRGKHNPAYKNGNSYNKRCWRGDNWDTLRQEIYERDAYKCQDCGIHCIGRKDLTLENALALIQCHHIENYKIRADNAKGNLITLCVGCHVKRHREGGDANEYGEADSRGFSKSLEGIS